VSDPVSLKVVSHHFRAVGERQLRQGASRRAGDVKIVGHAVSHTEVAKANAIRAHADQSQLKQFPPELVQFGELIEWRDLVTCALIRKLYVFTHGACSGKREKIPVSFASQVPRSVISPVTRCRGVTSKPKLAAALRFGAMCTSTCRPSSQPSARFISSPARCSIGICFKPSCIFQSIDDEGSAT